MTSERESALAGMLAAIAGFVAPAFPEPDKAASDEEFVAQVDSFREAQRGRALRAAEFAGHAAKAERPELIRRLTAALTEPEPEPDREAGQ